MFLLRLVSHWLAGVSNKLSHRNNERFANAKNVKFKKGEKMVDHIANLQNSLESRYISEDGDCQLSNMSEDELFDFVSNCETVINQSYLTKRMVDDITWGMLVEAKEELKDRSTEK